MNLRDANKKIEELDNEYEYWLQQKEALQTLVGPSSPKIESEHVSGGKRCDKYLKYAELEDEKKINDTLDYIFKLKQATLDFIEKELKRLKKWGDLEEMIVQLREIGIYDEKREIFVKLTINEIAKKVYCSPSLVKKILRKNKEQRYVEE